MKAAVLNGLNNIIVKEVRDPKISDNGVIIKVKACAVCGSDIRIFHSGNSRVNYPAIIGHEISGEVAEVGKNVRQVCCRRPSSDWRRCTVRRMLFL